MNKKERIMAAIEGRKPDRVPFVFWQPDSAGTGHPEVDAERAFRFYEEWDSDAVIPVNERGYAGKDYAVPAVTRNGGVLYSTDPEEWLKLRPLSVNEGALFRALETVKRLLEKVNGAAPVLFRVMSPAAALFDRSPQAAEDLRRGYGKEVKAALDAVTETTCALVQRAVELGADGIFLEAPMADYEEMTEKRYREYAMPYDLAVLAASAGWCNVIRAGRTDCLFSLLRKYPAQIFSWDSSQSLPRPIEARLLTGKCIMTGINRRSMEFGMKNEVERDLWRILLETGGEGIILSAGASVQPHRSMADFFQRSLQEFEEKAAAAEKNK